MAVGPSYHHNIIIFIISALIMLLSFLCFILHSVSSYCAIAIDQNYFSKLSIVEKGITIVMDMSCVIPISWC